MSVLDALLIAVVFAAAVWWLFWRNRRPALLEALSIAAIVLAVATVLVEGLRWQLVPWQALAVVVATAAALRRWRPGRSGRWRRVIGRVAIVTGLAVGGLLICLTAIVPALPEPAGPHQVGSEIFRWTDTARPETLTANAADRRQVVAQAWYPTDASGGKSVPYFEAQGKLPGTVAGLPPFMFAAFESVATHATFEPQISTAKRAWPVLLFSTGLSMPREMYTALCADLASRGFVVVALSMPYESGVSVLEGGKVVGQEVTPDVAGPPPHPEVQRLIDIRAADVGFVLDQLGDLTKLDPNSPLAGHLDLHHVGIVGHSIGGAAAVQAMAGDRRLSVGVNMDGKLFGDQPRAQLDRPFVWIQSGEEKTSEYAQGRDRFFEGLRGGGELLLVRDSVHMGFSDNPAFFTPIGRKLVGGMTAGSISAADMTAMAGDTIAASVGPSLGAANSPSLDEVIARHSAIRSDRRIPPTS